MLNDSLPVILIIASVVFLTVSRTPISTEASAISPYFTRQQITDKYGDLIDTTTMQVLNSTKQKNPLMDLTDILSVNYLSDGKNLSSVIWLASPFTKGTPITADILSYGVLIDADFNNQTGIEGADYSISINWNDTSHTWYKLFEELETPSNMTGASDTRVLNLTSDYKGFFKYGKRFVTLDADLGKMLFPQRYRVIFFSQYRDKDFWTVDFTNWISIPPPQLNISPFPNPVFLGRGEQTTIELRLNASSGYEPHVHLYTDNGNGDISVKFVPENLIIPSYGVSTAHLIVRASDIADEGEPITIPILADLTIPEKTIAEINSSKINKTSFISSPIPIPPSSVTNQGFTQYSTLSVNIMTFDEKLNNFVARFFNPITTIFTTSLAIFGGIMGYIFANRRK